MVIEALGPEHTLKVVDAIINHTGPIADITRNVIVKKPKPQLPDCYVLE